MEGESQNALIHNLKAGSSVEDVDKTFVLCLLHFSAKVLASSRQTFVISLGERREIRGQLCHSLTTLYPYSPADSSHHRIRPKHGLNQGT